MSRFTLSDFDYHLPEKLIAQEPVFPRDHARLLVYERKTAAIYDDYFFNIDRYLPVQTTLVLNNSKVEKCRLLFDKKEIFVLTAHNNRLVDALVRPGKKFKSGKKVKLDDDIFVEVVDIMEDGIRRLKFNRPVDSDLLDTYRHTPFPPYIRQNEELADEYQTVYAKPEGSKAAPTAGLHFTPDLLDILKKKHTVAEVTLHVGLGTFAPVKTENIDEHTMHSEWYNLTNETAQLLNTASHFTAVGTTSVRVLETAAGPGRTFKPQQRETDIFIQPNYRFKATDALITNFHLPKSTLLMLVAAFTGYEQMRQIYNHAINKEYRFYSFGDAMLIL